MILKDNCFFTCPVKILKQGVRGGELMDPMCILEL